MLYPAWHPALKITALVKTLAAAEARSYVNMPVWKSAARALFALKCPPRNITSCRLDSIIWRILLPDHAEELGSTRLFGAMRASCWPVAPGRVRLPGRIDRSGALSRVPLLRVAPIP